MENFVGTRVEIEKTATLQLDVDYLFNKFIIVSYKNVSVYTIEK